MQAKKTATKNKTKNNTKPAEVLKWSTRADCKSAGLAFVGSNPTLSTMQSNDMQKLLTQIPLLQSIENLDSDLMAQTRTETPNLFLGIGIVTSQHIATGVPIDILGMIFSAELLRRKLNSQKVFVFLADQHALTNEHLDKKLIKIQAAKTLHILSKLIINFDLQHFHLVQCTMLNFVPSIKEIFAQLPDIENQYLKHEIADILWLKKFHNVKFKLGWSMSKQSQVEGHDERFFDQTIQQFQSDVSFLHLKPGRTFDENRPRVSPYISLTGEKRILLEPKENATKKLATFKQDCPKPVFVATTRHLSQIVRLHDQLFEPFKFMRFEEKIQAILERATQ